MKQSINFYQFERAFKDMDRGNQFSYDGLKALFEWFEQLDEDSGIETELDVIAICCEFAEYENLQEFQEAYSKEAYPTMEDVEYATTVIHTEPAENNAFVIYQF